MTRKSLLLTALFFASFTALQAQPVQQGVRYVTSLPATCTAGGSASSSGPVRYNGVVYHCTATNTWTQSSPGSLITSTYAGLPTCAAGNKGQLVDVTDTTPGVYKCDGAGTWVIQGGSDATKLPLAGGALTGAVTTTSTITATTGGGFFGPGAAFSPFIPYDSNPVLSPGGGEFLAAFGSVLKVSSTYHMYYMIGNTTIGHATSSDGKTWTKDTANNPVFTVGAGGSWDADGVGTPNVWKEGATWYMLYRGSSAASGSVFRGGLATSTDGIAWTRQAVNNCATTSGNGCVIDKGFVAGGTETIEPYGVIKVGSTYYVAIDQAGGATRSLGIASSTDLLTWTKDSQNPLFTGGRYCAAWFKLGSYYYLLVNHYLGGAALQAEIEIYRDTSPVFRPTTRTYLGVVKQQSGAGWDSFALDTPIILTDDITRSTFAASGGDLWMYYAGTADSLHTNFYTGLAIAAQQPSFTMPQIGTLPNGMSVVGDSRMIGQAFIQGNSTTVAGLSLGSSGSNYNDISYNTVYTGTSGVYNYRFADTASMIRFDDGGFTLRGTATVGTAGNPITWTDWLAITKTGAIATKGIWTNIVSQQNKTTLGDSRVLKLIDNYGAASERQEIGLGYLFGSSTYQPIVLGSIVMDDSGQTASDFYIATRALTTDSAPIERFRVSAAGKLTFAGDLQAGTLIQLAGTTSSFPALKRDAATVQFRLADDSAYANVLMGNLTAVGVTATGNLIALELRSSAYYFGFGSAGQRGWLFSPSDGVFTLYNTATTDFGRLQFGGATTKFTALTPINDGTNAQGLIIQRADGTPQVFANLGAATNGSMIYCSDCTIANPCAGSGTGAIAKRLNGAWVCN